MGVSPLYIANVEMGLVQATKEQIMSHVAEYVKATEKEFRKHPETYLNKESWNDEIIKTNQNEKGTNRTPEGYNRAYDELKADGLL